jgi:peroxin-11B
MRLFKPLEHLQAALKAAASAEYPIEQFTTIGRQLGYFGYLSLDMIVWVCFIPADWLFSSFPNVLPQLNAIKFLRLTPEAAKKVNKTSQRFWLTGIAFSIACSLAKTGRLSQEIQKIKNGTSEKAAADDAERKLQIKSTAKYVDPYNALWRRRFVF